MGPARRWHEPLLHEPHLHEPQVVLLAWVGRDTDSHPVCPMPRECTCAAMDVNVCNASGLATLLARMPERLGPDSPWAGYLRAVYGGKAPAGFPLGRLELLYSNLLPLPCDQSLQRWQRGHCRGHASGSARSAHVRQPCADSECAAWFPRPAPTAADVARRVAYQPFRNFPPASQRLGAALMLQTSGPLRSPVPSSTWLQVIRHWPIDTVPRISNKNCRRGTSSVFHKRQHQCVFPEGTEDCRRPRLERGTPCCPRCST